MVFHFFRIPASTDTKLYSTVGQEVQARNLLGHQNGVTLGHQGNSGTESYGLGYCRGHGQCNERIVGVPILTRKVCTTWPWRFSTGRNMSMFRQKQRFKAVRLRLLRQCVWCYRVIRGKN
jgi:hypothetical protein